MKTNLTSTNNFEDIDNHHRLTAISTFLKEYRINSGYTQQELSQQSNLHRNTIIRAENAKNITLLSLFELADALDLSPKELFLDIE
jgi:transcriptional regulator with XRE-family HTH domain